MPKNDHVISFFTHLAYRQSNPFLVLHIAHNKLVNDAPDGSHIHVALETPH